MTESTVYRRKRVASFEYGKFEGSLHAQAPLMKSIIYQIVSFIDDTVFIPTHRLTTYIPGLRFVSGIIF
jgi:hypothetical protein